MSADAAGITVCLFALSHLSFEYTTDIFSRHYHWLLEYAKDHAEARAIFADWMLPLESVTETPAPATAMRVLALVSPMVDGASRAAGLRGCEHTG